MPLNNYGVCGPFGRCAQPDEHGFATLRQLGYNHIVKLNSDDEFPDDVENKLFVPGAVWHVPMNSFRPDEGQVRGLVAELQLVVAPSKAVIHCTHGRDRTGLVCAAWRILIEGWSVEGAWNEMKRYDWTPLSSLTDAAIRNVLVKLGRTVHPL